jgi:hypothetical protein
MVMVAIVADDESDHVSSVTVGGSTATRLFSPVDPQNSVRSYVYYSYMTAAGNPDSVLATWSGADVISMVATAYTGTASTSAFESIDAGGAKVSSPGGPNAQVTVSYNIAAGTSGRIAVFVPALRVGGGNAAPSLSSATGGTFVASRGDFSIANQAVYVGEDYVLSSGANSFSDVINVPGISTGTWIEWIGAVFAILPSGATAESTTTSVSTTTISTTITSISTSATTTLSTVSGILTSSILSTLSSSTTVSNAMTILSQGVTAVSMTYVSYVMNETPIILYMAAAIFITIPTFMLLMRTRTIAALMAGLTIGIVWAVAALGGTFTYLLGGVVGLAIIALVFRARG